jgi:hypothetical protein
MKHLATRGNRVSKSIENASRFSRVLAVALLISPLLCLTVASARVAEPPDARRKHAENDVPFTTLDKGSMSGIKKHHRLAIRDDNAWLCMWKQHTADTISRPAPPHVDFDQSMVIAVFQGQEGEAPGLVSIDRIKLIDDQLVVSLADKPHEDDGVHAKSTTRSYHIVRLAKNSLPVVFK